MEVISQRVKEIQWEEASRISELLEEKHSYKVKQLTAFKKERHRRKIDLERLKTLIQTVKDLEEGINTCCHRLEELQENIQKKTASLSHQDHQVELLLNQETTEDERLHLLKERCQAEGLRMPELNDQMEKLNFYAGNLRGTTYSLSADNSNKKNKLLNERKLKDELRRKSVDAEVQVQLLNSRCQQVKEQLDEALLETQSVREQTQLLRANNESQKISLEDAMRKRSDLIRQHEHLTTVLLSHENNVKLKEELLGKLKTDTQKKTNDLHAARQMVCSRPTESWYNDPWNTIDN